MRLNQRIREALEPIGLPVVPDVDTQQRDRCLIFNYSTVGDFFSDDVPQFERCLIQIHYICPHGWNSLEERRAVKRALFAAGFSWPEETPASDSTRKDSENKQHYVFECEWLEGIEDGTD